MPVVAQAIVLAPVGAGVGERDGEAVRVGDALAMVVLNEGELDGEGEVIAAIIVHGGDSW